MNVSLFAYVWVLQLLAGMLALSIFVRCVRSMPSPSAVAGIFYALVLCIFAWSLGVAGVWGSMPWVSGDSRQSEYVLETTLILPNGKIFSSTEPREAKGWLNLSRPGPTLAEFASDSHRDGVVPVLYAGEGVHGSYVEDIKTTFGDIQPLNSQSLQTICYQSNSVLGFRDHRCAKRHAAVAIDVPVNQRIAGTIDETVVASATINGAPAVLVGYDLDPSSENLRAGEACLVALASGRACIVPTFLPADTQMTMLRLPSAYGDVLKEFGIQNVETMPTKCLGSIEGDLAAAVPEDLWAGFTDVKSEAGLSRFIEGATSRWIQAPMTTLQIPELSGLSEASALPLIRSLLANLKEDPLWIASCEQVRARFTALQDIEGAILENGRGFELHRLSGIERLSTFVVSPIGIRPDVTSIESQDEWDLYRVNDRIVQLVASTGSLRANIDFRAGENRMALLSREMRLFLFVALMLGGMAALIQSLAASAIMNVSPLPMGTALPVAGLLFIWLWYSYQYSLSAGSGNSALVAIDAVERPLLLAEVPDEFFLETSAPTQGENFVKMLAELRDKIPSVPEKLAVLKASGQPKPVLKYQQNGRVVLLNSLSARNFFYRKSSAYSAAVAAWEDLLTKEKISHDIADDDTLESYLRSNVKVLIVPDARFVPASEAALSSWIGAGGIVVFTDRLSDEVVESERAGRLLLASVGTATVTTSSWSSTAFQGASLAIDGQHRIIRQSGQASVVRGQARGKGGIVFYGAHPGLGRARELSSFMLKNLTGQVMEVSGASECRALLAFEPYRIPVGEVSRLVTEVNGASFSVAISSSSLPAMVASYSALKDRIVIIDDGDWKNRYLSAAIFAEILQTTPTFIYINEKVFPTQGPASDYRAGMFVSDATPQKVYAAIRESCRSFEPRPIIVGSDFVVKHRDFIRKIAQDKSIKFQSPTEFVARRTAGSTRVIRMRTTVQDPLQFSDEVK